MRTTLLYGAAAGTQNSVNYLEFPANTRINGFQVFLSSDMDADGEQVQWEISTVPYLQLNQNEARGILAIFGLNANLTTSGSMISSLSQFIPANIVLKAQERIYLNAFLTGTTASTVAVIVHHS